MHSSTLGLQWSASSTRLWRSVSCLNRETKSCWLDGNDKVWVGNRKAPASASPCVCMRSAGATCDTSASFNFSGNEGTQEQKCCGLNRESSKALAMVCDTIRKLVFRIFERKASGILCLWKGTSNHLLKVSDLWLRRVRLCNCAFQRPQWWKTEYRKSCLRESNSERCWTRIRCEGLLRRCIRFPEFCMYFVRHSASRGAEGCGVDQRGYQRGWACWDWPLTVWF